MATRLAVDLSPRLRGAHVCPPQPWREIDAHAHNKSNEVEFGCYIIGNGDIDYEEFKSIVSDDSLTTETDVKEAFCVFDRDESGYIGIEEISLMFSRFGHDLKAEYIEAVTQAADVDADGTITFKGRARQWSR